jgi:hypothetical protein
MARSRGLGDVYKRQVLIAQSKPAINNFLFIQKSIDK